MRDSSRSRRCRGYLEYLCQKIRKKIKKDRLLANGCTTWWGGPGKGLARPLDLIFSLSFCSQLVSTCQDSFLCHKGCIHLNWKKYARKNTKPDSRAKTTRETVPLIFSKPLRLVLKTRWYFAHCTLLLCSVNKPSTMTLFPGLLPDACT